MVYIPIKITSIMQVYACESSSALSSILPPLLTGNNFNLQTIIIYQVHTMEHNIHACLFF